MITESVFAKQEINEAERAKAFTEATQKAVEHFSGQDEQKETAGAVLRALQSRKTLELDGADEDACLIAAIYYYIASGRPIVISGASVERREELIKKVRGYYRTIKGERAKVISITGEKAAVLVIRGVEDVDLDPQGLEFLELKTNAIVNNCITFCDHDFLIRDLKTEPDEYDINYRLLPAKYDAFLVLDADKLNESAAKADAKRWDHKSARELLDNMLFIAEGLQLTDGTIDRIKKAKKCLSDLVDQIIDDSVKTIDYAAFAPLKEAMTGLSLPPVTEWGAFYSKERQALYNMLDPELNRELDALEAIVAGTDADSLWIRHRLGKYAFASVITEKTKTRGAYYNTFVYFAKDPKQYDGVAEMKKLVGEDPDLSLVLAK
ncbi:MAG: hypothetical protein LIO75_02735 [Lachnospiraceae bacterium]|nr:hypothetical protein [Lachnospiraceae bacterium]